MLFLALLFQAAAPIVVEGRRFESELADCVARGCPPAEEMELSLQASVQQFQDGRYDSASANLQRTIARNERFAAEEPALLSSLYSTLATVTRHSGDLSLNRRSTYSALRILQAHAPEHTYNIIKAELDVADMHLLRGDVVQAERSLAAAGRTAHSHRHDRVAAFIALRRGSLAASRGRLMQTQRLVSEATALAGGKDRVVYEVGQILIHRAQAAQGDRNAIDRLASSLQQQQGVAPMLIEQQPLPAYMRDPLLLEADLGLRPLWADVGFWVRPDGRTSGAEILRAGNRDRGWIRPLLSQIEQRRYAPRALEPGDPGAYRIERVTLRSEHRTPLGSRIPRATGLPDFEVVDLTHLSDMDEASDALSKDRGFVTAKTPSRNNREP